MSKFKHNDRILPPVLKHVMEISFLRRLTLKERLKIAAGHNLVIDIKVKCQHNAGQFQPSSKVTLTPEKEAVQVQREMIEGAVGAEEGK